MALKPFNQVQPRSGISSGAGAATAQTVTPFDGGNLETDDTITEVWNVSDHSVIALSTVTISAQNEITIVASTTSKNLHIMWHDANVA